MDTKWLALLSQLYSPDAWQLGVIKSLVFVFVVLSLLAGIRAVLSRHFGLDKTAFAAVATKVEAELKFPYKRPRMERFSLVVMAGVYYLLALGVGLQWVAGLRRARRRDPFGAGGEIHLVGLEDEDGGQIVIQPPPRSAVEIDQVLDAESPARLLAMC